MPIHLQSRIDSLDVQMQLFRNDLYVLWQHMYNLGVHLNAEGNPNSSTDAFGCSNDLFYMMGHWGPGTTTIMGYQDWCLQYINDNAFNGGGGDPYVLTMDAILDCMWNSDKLRWFHFINYIDSMRAGIWNTEIHTNHLEDWYRHFSI